MKLLISSSQKLLGMILLNNKFDFDEYVTSLCRKASQKLNALARVAFYMNLSQRRLMINVLIFSQFGYCPLVWMFHGRKLNNSIKNIHERALRTVYRDYKSTFQLLLKQNKSIYTSKKPTYTCYRNFWDKEWFKPSNHWKIFSSLKIQSIIFEMRKLSTEAMWILLNMAPKQLLP